MTDADGDVTRAQIRETIEREFGPPIDVLELRHQGESAKVLTEIDVLCFEPRPGEQLEEEWFVYVLTCGLGARVLDGPTPRFELLASVQGRVSVDERRRLARRLAELGTLPFRDGFGLPAEIVLDGVTLPLFERRTHAVLRLFLGLEYLPMDPPIALIEITPVFAGEAEQIRRLGVGESFYRFALAGVKADDPKRREVELDGVTVPVKKDRPP
jgi:hypothetical protein